MLNQVRFDGNCYNVTSNGALLVDALADAYPDWICASKMDFSKPSKVKNSLPQPIKELIETQSGKGYRFKRAVQE